ncbi:MAG: Alkaline phosphatase synthesis sensor protein PhoR [Bacteroidetes bacterium ADurb.Bin123]|nr:MAG: Alkaline phosphatase synthesis sensor protein PhoR [Bacteroidetes bacterium ADurb.Bin123]
MEREDFEYDRKPESLSAMVNDAMESVKLLLEDKQGSITLQLDEKDDTVMADRHHLTNVFVNLLTNSLKYSGRQPDMQIRSVVMKNEIVVEFTDNGIGIPTKYQKYIFDKYFRVPTGDVHDNKGFGIGLSYVKSVVTAHHGKVTVSSEPGKGSIFTVVLPLAVNRDE